MAFADWREIGAARPRWPSRARAGGAVAALADRLRARDPISRGPGERLNAGSGRQRAKSPFSQAGIRAARAGVPFREQGRRHCRPCRRAAATRDTGRGTYGAGHTRAVAALPRFVVQLHDATTLHFDLRLQAGEILRSWAVPKGPSLDPAVRRLAVPVEDHTLAAGEFEGVHEGQSRGSGAVIIWDEGTAEILRDEPGHVSFILHGRKLSGGFALTRTGNRRWVLVKVRDEAARPGSDIVTERPASVRSGRTWQELLRP